MSNTYTLAIPTVGQIHHKNVESILSVVGNGLVNAVSIVPRLPVQQARTRIARTASTSHILFADDDMVYDANTVLQLKRHAEAGKRIVCGLAMSRTDKENRAIVMKWYDDADKFEGRDGYFGFAKDFNDKEASIVDGGTLAFVLVAKDVFDEIGYDFSFGENPPRGEDIEFYERVRKAGIEVWLEPNARVGHLTNKELRYEG